MAPRWQKGGGEERVTYIYSSSKHREDGGGGWRGVEVNIHITQKYKILSSTSYRKNISRIYGKYKSEIILRRFLIGLPMKF